MEFDDLSRQVIGCAIEVHRQLGPGLLESAYQRCLVHELNHSGIKVASEVSMPIKYKGETLESGYCADLVIGDRALLLELKSVDQLLPVHEAQILTYMKISKIRIGLLMNFNLLVLKAGLKRYVMKFSSWLFVRPLWIFV